MLDGEIVAFVDGRPSFEALQERMHVRDKAEARRLAEKTPVTFMAFDLLRPTASSSPTGRCASAARALEPWAAEHARHGQPDLRRRRRRPSRSRAQHGLEGVVAKRLDSRYRAGLRTSDWVKLRFLSTGDFAVVGWEESREHPGHAQLARPRDDDAGRPALRRQGGQRA